MSVLRTICIIATVILPGTGHLLLRRYLRGAVLAALFAASADVFLGSVFLWPGAAGTELTLISCGVMTGSWLYALIDLLARLNVLRTKDFQSRKDELLKSAQVAWLKDEYAEAERLLREIIRLDECDVEAWVHLGKVLKSSGRPEEAGRCFRSALNLDGSQQWRWELMRELGYADVASGETEAS
jgi:tetratricopeptide (TPR) repeat protein